MSDRSGMDPRTVRLDPRGNIYFTTARDPGAHARDMSRRQLIEDAENEALERVQRLSIAKSTGSVKRQMGVYRTEEERVIALASERQRVENLSTVVPCPLCGVRSDTHHDFGCKRWSPE